MEFFDLFIDLWPVWFFAFLFTTLKWEESEKHYEQPGFGPSWGSVYGVLFSVLLLFLLVATIGLLLSPLIEIARV